MKPRARQNQNHPPCPRAPARPHVRLSDTTRTGRAAEDVGPYHPSCPDAARRAKDPRRPRRGTFERARRAKDSRRPRRRAFVADEVADEAARKPASKPFSVSPCLPALRVNRPEARSPVRSRRSAPLPVAIGHPAHGAGRRGRRPLPPILPRRGPAREVPAPPPARAVRRRVWGGGMKPRAGQPQNLRALRVNHTRRRYDR